jgi:hypothetical protein
LERLDEVKQGINKSASEKREEDSLSVHTNKTENDHGEIGRGAGSSEWSEEFAASEKNVQDFHPVTAGWNGWRFAKVAHRNLLKNLGRLFMRREAGSGPDPQEITDKNLAQVNWWHSLLLIVCGDHPLVVFALGVANMVC